MTTIEPNGPTEHLQTMEYWKELYLTSIEVGNEMRSSYLAEINRLRTLVIDTAVDLEVVEQALVPLCQDSTDENADQRCALFELRTVIANLTASGRPTVEGGIDD
jgi:hypothetical protein